MNDLDRLLKFKEKMVIPSRELKSYKTCEQVIEEIMSLKSKVTDLQQKGDYLRKKEVKLKGG